MQRGDVDGAPRKKATLAVIGKWAQSTEDGEESIRKWVKFDPNLGQHFVCRMHEWVRRKATQEVRDKMENLPSTPGEP